LKSVAKGSRYEELKVILYVIYIIVSWDWKFNEMDFSTIMSFNDLVATVETYHESFKPPTQWIDPATVIIMSMLGMYSFLLAMDHFSFALMACAFGAGAFTAYMPRRQTVDHNMYMDIKPKRKIEVCLDCKSTTCTYISLSTEFVASAPG
jgi:hypothetical protein